MQPSGHHVLIWMNAKWAALTFFNVGMPWWSAFPQNQLKIRGIAKQEVRRL
jgi:hypothetical protein